MAKSKHPIVAAEHYIIATRDSGYRSTATAVAELIDNSVQAGAKQIDILVTQTDARPDRQIEIAVCDNGHGMDARTLRRALQFGGTERFNDRKGAGRYGMGLPNASVSQARRLDVFSWKNNATPVHCYIDVDEIAAGYVDQIPTVRRRVVPSTIRTNARSGTIVIWSRCDRLDNRKATTIASKLFAPLGRIFRMYLAGGGSITVNGRNVRPIDPLFLAVTSHGESAKLYGQPLAYRVRVPDSNGAHSVIRVRFSLLPVKHWHALPISVKRELGVVGGAGVSVVRAGREIDHGWFFLTDKRRQNYDDWWRCEVSFEPALDELFGVTHSKQEINPAPELESIISGDITAAANKLSSAVRKAFSSIERGRSAVTTAEKNEWRLPSRSTCGGRHTPTSHGRVRLHSGYRYKVEIRRTGEVSFFCWTERQGTLSVTLNADHPFYTRVYTQAARGEAIKTEELDLIILAAARAEALCVPGGETQREAWSNALAAFLEA